MPAKLKLTYDLVAQIVELKRDGLCRTAGAVRVKAREATAEGGSALTRANPTRGARNTKTASAVFLFARLPGQDENRGCSTKSCEKQ